MPDSNCACKKTKQAAPSPPAAYRTTLFTALSIALATSYAVILSLNESGAITIFISTRTFLNFYNEPK